MTQSQAPKFVTISILQTTNSEFLNVELTDFWMEIGDLKQERSLINIADSKRVEILKQKSGFKKQDLKLGEQYVFRKKLDSKLVPEIFNVPDFCKIYPTK